MVVDNPLYPGLFQSGGDEAHLKLAHIRLWGKYSWNLLYEPVLMGGLKPLLTEFGIHYSLEIRV